MLDSLRRVLVVDDDPSIREIISDVLELLGCAVHTAANGKEALEKMAAARPDMILLDYMMPIMDGRAFGLELRGRPQYAGLPIVLMSAARNADEVCHAIGARACLRKPFDIDQLAEIIERLTQ